MKIEVERVPELKNIDELIAFISGCEQKKQMRICRGTTVADIHLIERLGNTIDFEKDGEIYTIDIKRKVKWFER